MENLYDVLDINEFAEENEIKKAYAQMVRKFPPEKNPEKFKKIREAYEKLNDPKSRMIYDAYLMHGEEINKHLELGNEALSDEDFKSAIKEFKKILLLTPNLDEVKNKLGIAFLENGQYDEALIQFKELILRDNKNLRYYSNLAHAYGRMENYIEAEYWFKKAHHLNPGDFSIIKDISDTYILKKDYDKAIIFLTNCIQKSPDIMVSIDYYSELIKVYIIAERKDDIEDLLEKIIGNLPENPEVKSHVLLILIDLSSQLIIKKIFDVAYLVSIKAASLDQNSEEAAEFCQSLEKLKEFSDLYKVLDNDVRIMKPLIGPIFYSLYANENYSQIDEDKQQNYDAIDSYITQDPEYVLSMIDILKSEYHELWLESKEIYDDIETKVYEYLDVEAQLETFNKDPEICISISKLVSLWLMTDITERQRAEYYKIFLNEINNEQESKLLFSILKIKEIYKQVYNLKPEFFDSILESLQNSVQGEISTSRYDLDIESEKYYNANIKNNENKTNNNNTSGSGIGCGFIIFCAVIGAVIIPGFGFFVGAAVGFYLSEKKS